MSNFRTGYLEQGAPLGGVKGTAVLSADNQAVVVEGIAQLQLSSDNTTAANRTFTLSPSTLVGHRLSLVFESGSSTTCQLANSGTVKLVSAWEPVQYQSLTLEWDGSYWIEVSRSLTTIPATTSLTSAHIFVGNGSNLAADVAMSGSVAITNAGVTSLSASNSALKLARYTVAYTDLTTATTGVPFVSGITLPDNAIVLQGIVDVTTTFAGDGDDSSTISLGIDDQDVDLLAAVAIKTGTSWDAGLKALIPVGTAATAVKLTAARQLAVTWDAVATDTTLTAGSMDVFLMYMEASA